VVRGDLVDGLPRLLQEAPSGSTLVVYHSAVLPYVKPAKWEAFQDLLLDWSNERDIVWVSNEGPGLPSSVDELAPPREELRFRLGRTVFSKGQRKQQLLALAHYHGLDIEWLHA
jgi:hypothetical protein